MRYNVMSPAGDVFQVENEKAREVGAFIIAPMFRRDRTTFEPGFDPHLWTVNTKSGSSLGGGVLGMARARKCAKAMQPFVKDPTGSELETLFGNDARAAYDAMRAVLAAK